MAHGDFVVSDTNPNDNVGGGGCICDYRKQVDCKPPYCVFPANRMLMDQSPHVVVSAACVKLMAAKLEDAGALRSVGSPATIQDIDNSVGNRPAAPAPPVVETPDPERDFEDIPEL